MTLLFSQKISAVGYVLKDLIVVTRRPPVNVGPIQEHTSVFVDQVTMAPV